MPWYFDNYLKNICGMSNDDVMETKLNFLYHTMEILTRNDFWEVYTEAEAQNWQGTLKFARPFNGILQRSFTTMAAMHQQMALNSAEIRPNTLLRHTRLRTRYIGDYHTRVTLTVSISVGGNTC